MDDRTKVSLGRTNTSIVRGEADLSVWDDEELLRGQRRDKNGNWSGRPPKVVPREVHQELARRRMSQAYHELTEALGDAAKTLRKIINDDDVDAETRLKAIHLLMDRVMPKPTERIQFEHRSRFIEALEDMVLVYDEDDVIDANAEEA